MHLKHYNIKAFFFFFVILQKFFHFMLFVSFGGVKTPLFFIKRCYGTLCKNTKSVFNPLF